MSSMINVDVPAAGNATTASVRQNFVIIKNEIEALQNGGTQGAPGADGVSGISPLKIKMPNSINAWFLPSLRTGGTISTFASGALMIFKPFMVDRALNFSAMGINVGTLVAGSTAVAAIYANDSSTGFDRPGALLFSSSVFNCATGWPKANAVNGSLQPGVIYWLMWHSSVSLSMYAVPNTASDCLGGTNVNLNISCLSAPIAYTAGVPPAEIPLATVLTGATTNFPAIGLLRA